jgi:4-amino-4-deoxy-L-arabinose transferase-like glycosyltransferase
LLWCTGMVIPIALFLVALGARIVTGALFVDPAYPDSFYYVNVAHSLAAGHGFQVDFIWNFVETGGRLPATGVLPIPSNAHWMPLASLVQVPFIWLLGPVPLASALPFWLASAATAPVTYWIGRDAALPRWQATAAGLMVALPALVDPFLAQPDNFGLFMLLGTLSLWACARGLRGDRRSFAVGGVLVGLAFLSRNDGVLLGIPFALVFLADLVRRPRASRIGWKAALLCAGGFLLVASPWILRQLEVFGSISPSAASGRILWITQYRDLYSVSTEATPASFLAQGLVPLLTSRVLGLVNALGLFATQVLLIFLVPFLLLGVWWQRHDLAWRPWMIYAATLFLSSGLLFAVHVPNGTFLHSAVALIPYTYLLTLLGIGGVVAAVARRRPSWDPVRATRVFSLMAVGVVLVMGLVSTVMTARSWRDYRDVALSVAAPLASADPADRIMTPDAGGFRYLTGHPGIVTPEDPLPVVEDALRRYGVRWLILERDFSTLALGPVLEGKVRPDWLSAPVTVVPDPADPSHPKAALYAVCLTPDDARCTP